MTEYRKKPVVIDAEQWDGTARDAGRIIDWLLDEFPDTHPPIFREVNETPERLTCELHIHTLEGVMVAHPGDWLIVGVQGELYPCKPDIFAATYEAVTA